MSKESGTAAQCPDYSDVSTSQDVRDALVWVETGVRPDLKRTELIEHCEGELGRRNDTVAVREGLPLSTRLVGVAIDSTEPEQQARRGE